MSVRVMPKVTFLPSGVEVEVKEGTILLDAGLDNNIRINHNCGGNCACASCHVHVEEGADSLNPTTADELEMLEEAIDRRDSSRLSCQCRVKSDLVVHIPPSEEDDLDDLL